MAVKVALAHSPELVKLADTHPRYNGRVIIDLLLTLIVCVMQATLIFSLMEAYALMSHLELYN
jgi:hypothetical protein